MSLAVELAYRDGSTETVGGYFADMRAAARLAIRLADDLGRAPARDAQERGMAAAVAIRRDGRVECRLVVFAGGLLPGEGETGAIFPFPEPR